MAHDPVFVIQTVIGAIIKRAAQKLPHFVLIQILLANIAFIVFVVNIIDTGFTIAHTFTAFLKNACGISKTNTIPSTIAIATFTARNPLRDASCS